MLPVNSNWVIDYNYVWIDWIDGDVINNLYSVEVIVFNACHVSMVLKIVSITKPIESTNGDLILTNEELTDRALLTTLISVTSYVTWVTELVRLETMCKLFLNWKRFFLFLIFYNLYCFLGSMILRANGRFTGVVLKLMNKIVTKESYK